MAVILGWQRSPHPQLQTVVWYREVTCSCSCSGVVAVISCAVVDVVEVVKVVVVVVFVAVEVM